MQKVKVSWKTFHYGMSFPLYTIFFVQIVSSFHLWYNSVYMHTYKDSSKEVIVHHVVGPIRVSDFTYFRL